MPLSPRLRKNMDDARAKFEAMPRVKVLRLIETALISASETGRQDLDPSKDAMILLEAIEVQLDLTAIEDAVDSARFL